MTIRTTETTVTFRNTFTLSFIDVPQPAGNYRLVMGEEEILGFSILAFHHTATMLHLPAVSASSPSYQAVPIDPAELQAFLEADGRASPDDG
jgi:hypothetical protein